MHVTTAHSRSNSVSHRPAPDVIKTRRVMVGPGVYAHVKVPSSALPRIATRLGSVAQAIADQTVVTTLSVAAVSGYVYALTQAASPQVTFTDMPPGMTGSLADLQGAYAGFQTQFAIFQGQAEVWINTQQSSGSPSIFSQLVAVPNTLDDINGTVQSNFTLLSALTPGTPPYQSALSKQETLIGAEQPAITSLVKSMSTLGTNLDTAATSLIASTQTGVLSQMLAAYASDIAKLNADITTCNQTISADNSKIVGEGVGAATSIAVGIVGLTMWWNPIGWVMIAGGAVGAYFAIVEIESLKAQIAELTVEINADTNYVNTDQAAASQMSGFCTQLQGFAALNTAAQLELSALEQLYSTLAQDITAALSDLSADDLTDAATEWNTILAAANVLSGLTAYVWPPPTLLSAPSSFAAVGGDIYFIATSGEMYHYSAGAWTDMTVKALSCAGSGSAVVAIDGAPIDGSVATGNPPNSTYLVKSYDPASGAWANISTFPAAGIAVAGGAIYAINQTVSDRGVYQYSGSGTSWTALPQLPGPDAAYQIAVAGGQLFALSTNSQSVYQYDASNSSWTAIASPCASITGNGDKLGIVNADRTASLYDPTAGGSPAAMGTEITQIAQISDGNQYSVHSDLGLWLAVPGDPVTSTFLAANVTGVYASDTDQVYYVDNLGNLYSLSASGTSTKLPAIPTPA